jgi:hypothetical protein
MKFPYVRVPCRSGNGVKITSVLRPLIHIGLKTKNSEIINTFALIDSGADYCISPSEFGEQIGLSIKNNSWIDIFGISGQPIRFYFHDIILTIGGWQKESRMGFSHDLKLDYIILGQKGFFDFYTINFDYKKEDIELKEHISLKTSH